MAMYKQHRLSIGRVRRQRGVCSLLRCCMLVVAIFVLYVLLVMHLDAHSAPHEFLTDWNVASFVAAPALENMSHAILPTQDIDGTVLRRPDGRGGEVRVLVLLLSTQANTMLCYAVASAYFAGLPVAVVGIGIAPFKPIQKWSVFVDAVERAGLEASDVVIPLDADVLFSGETMLPYIDRFIRLSAPSHTLVDVRAVREGRAMAASTFGTEEDCFSPQFCGTYRGTCKWYYHTVEEQIMAYYEAHGMNSTMLTQYGEPTARKRYINSGTSIHRVWALRELSAALTYFISQHKPADGYAKWHCDQSVVTALYHNLRLTEVRNSAYFTTATPRQQAVRSTYGVSMGMIGIDISNELSRLYLDSYLDELKHDSELWRSTAVMSTAVDQWYRPDTTANVTSSTCETVSDAECGVNATAMAHNMSLRNEEERVAGYVRAPLPLLLHYAGSDKISRIGDTIAYIPWYIVATATRQTWQQAHDYLLSMPMELWKAAQRVHVRYADICPQHPFSVSPKWE